MTKPTLSVIASRIKHIFDSHMEAAELDAGFDAGEFSGPSHYRMASRETEVALTESGWSATEFLDALYARTNWHWIHTRCYWSHYVEEIESRKEGLS